MKNDYPILSLCAQLAVSPSGYYVWQKRRTTPGPRTRANQTLAQQIQTIHTQSRQTYGSPRIVAVLRQQGHRHGRNRVARRMREAGLQGRQRRRYCVHTTDMESFWSTLKWELVYRRDFATRTQARTEIFDYIEVFYNRQRLHSALGYCSPVDFELKITNY